MPTEHSVDRLDRLAAAIQNRDYKGRLCSQCAAELDADGDCPTCDSWLEDEFEDE